MITLGEDVHGMEGSVGTLLGEVREASRKRGEGEEPGTAREARRGPFGGQGSETPPHVDPNNLSPAPPFFLPSLPLTLPGLGTRA